MPINYGVKSTRKFGGKIYQIEATHTTKHGAKENVEHDRKHGYLARFTSFKNRKSGNTYYAVYRRRK